MFYPIAVIIEVDDDDAAQEWAQVLAESLSVGLSEDNYGVALFDGGTVAPIFEILNDSEVVELALEEFEGEGQA